MRAAAVGGCLEAGPPSRIFMAHEVATDLLPARIYVDVADDPDRQIDSNLELNSGSQFAVH